MPTNLNEHFFPSVNRISNPMQHIRLQLLACELIVFIIKGCRFRFTSQWFKSRSWHRPEAHEYILQFFLTCFQFRFRPLFARFHRVIQTECTILESLLHVSLLNKREIAILRIITCEREICHCVQILFMNSFPIFA